MSYEMFGKVQKFNRRKNEWETIEFYDKEGDPLTRVGIGNSSEFREEVFPFFREEGCYEGRVNIDEHNGLSLFDRPIERFVNEKYVNENGEIVSFNYMKIYSMSLAALKYHYNYFKYQVNSTDDNEYYTTRDVKLLVDAFETLISTIEVIVKMETGYALPIDEVRYIYSFG